MYSFLLWVLKISGVYKKFTSLIFAPKFLTYCILAIKCSSYTHLQVVNVAYCPWLTSLLDSLLDMMPVNKALLFLLSGCRSVQTLSVRMSGCWDCTEEVLTGEAQKPATEVLCAQRGEHAYSQQTLHSTQPVQPYPVACQDEGQSNRGQVNSLPHEGWRL